MSKKQTKTSNSQQNEPITSGSKGFKRNQHQTADKTREQEKWEDKRDRKGRLRDFYVILAGDERFIRTIIYNLKPWKRDENNMAIIPYKRNVKVIKRLLKQNLNKQKIKGDEK